MKTLKHLFLPWVKFVAGILTSPVLLSINCSALAIRYKGWGPEMHLTPGIASCTNDLWPFVYSCLHVFPFRFQMDRAWQSWGAWWLASAAARFEVSLQKWSWKPLSCLSLSSSWWPCPLLWKGHLWKWWNCFSLWTSQISKAPMTHSQEHWLPGARHWHIPAHTHTAFPRGYLSLLTECAAGQASHVPIPGPV